MYKLTNAEIETTIRWNREEMIAYIFTSDYVQIKKLDALCDEFPDTYKCIKIDDGFGSKTYTCPAKKIKFGRPTSEAKKAAARKGYASMVNSQSESAN